MKNQFDGETLLLTGGSGMTGAAIAAHLLARFPGLCIRQVYYSTPPALHHSRLESVRADLQRSPDDDSPSGIGLLADPGMPEMAARIQPA